MVIQLFITGWVERPTYDWPQALCHTMDATKIRIVYGTYREPKNVNRVKKRTILQGSCQSVFPFSSNILLSTRRKKYGVRTGKSNLWSIWRSAVRLNEINLNVKPAQEGTCVTVFVQERINLTSQPWTQQSRDMDPFSVHYYLSYMLMICLYTYFRQNHIYMLMIRL